MIRSNKGSADPITLGVIAVLLLGVAGWKPLNFFKKDPPVEQVVALQLEAIKAREAAEAARLAAEQRATQERERKDEQVRYAQQMNEGASLALSKSKDKGPEIVFASDLLKRSSVALALAVGDLPAARRAEIITIVDQALSGLEAERDAARAALAQRDEDLKIITAERQKLAEEHAKKLREAEELTEKNRVVQAQLDEKTTAVTDWARKTLQEERRAGSLEGALNKIIKAALYLGAAYLFIVFILPGIVKHLRPGKVKNLLRDVSGYTTNPLLYHDAKHKIDDLKHHEPPVI